MTAHHDSSGTILRWHVDALPFDQIRMDRVEKNADLFYFLAGASFVEIASDLYTRSLIKYYDGDEMLTGWLRDEWEPQELQHGAALRRYVETVWPEFDWAKSYEDFRAAYGPLCKPELFGPTRGLELAARCAVETGTATIYTMIHDLTDEPVLRQLTKLIRNDEASHYSHFLKHFKRYRQVEGLSRGQVFRTLWGRVTEANDEDAWYAFRSIHKMAAPEGDTQAAYHRYMLRAKGSMYSYYPCSMAVTMLLKPLDLNQHLQRLAVRMISFGARSLLGVNRFLLRSATV